MLRINAEVLVLAHRFRGGDIAGSFFCVAMYPGKFLNDPNFFGAVAAALDRRDCIEKYVWDKSRGVYQKWGQLSFQIRF